MSKKRQKRCCPPDLAGRVKPPCFMCGNESAAWITKDGRRRRVCAGCACTLASGCYCVGSDIAIVARGSRVVLFRHQEGKTF